jgi:CheY-like chemotaxis protein
MQTSTPRPRLLLVDSDPKSLRVLDVSLKKAGFQVLTATNGLEALAALESAPDLVISDTHMPEMDGFELCRRIKQRPEWARLPFIFLSSRKSVEEKVRGLELGVDDYLTKPIYVKEIVTRVTMLLQRGQRERLESRREPLTKYTGLLADIGVIDLVQTIEVNRKSGVVHIATPDGRRGELYFRDGQVIDAEAGRLSGPEAVYRLFSWTEGAFEVEFKPLRQRNVIELSPQALLMEGMRRLEEWTRLLESTPPLEKVFEVDYHLLAERLAQLPDEVNGILRLFDGRRRLYEVIEDCDVPDLEALTVVGRLYADRLIRETTDDGRAPARDGAVPARLERWLKEGPTSRAAPRAPIDRRGERVDAMDIERRGAPRGPLHDARSEPMPLSPPEPRISGGDIIPFPAQGDAPGSPSLPDGGRAAAVAHADNPTGGRMSPSAERSEPATGFGAASSGGRDLDQQPSGSRSSPRLASPVAATKNTGMAGGPSADRNHFDGPEDTLVTAMAAARRQRGLLAAAGAFALVIILAALFFRGNRARSGLAPSQAPVAVVAPPAPPAPVVPPPPVAAPVTPAAPVAGAAAPVAGSPPAVADTPAPPAPAGSGAAAAPVAGSAAAVPPAAAAPTPTPAAEGEVAVLKADCVKAYNKGRGKYKAIVSACAKVLEADSKAADVMVFLANAEFQRGATKESMEWAQRALAIDANLPDPYVFVGNGEQIAGHRKEAKAAYEKYLELAPTGSYATDLRAVLKSL